MTKWCKQCQVYSVSGVIRVGVTWGGNWGCHPYFSRKKTDDPFFAHHCHFYTYIDFTRVSLPPPFEGVIPHLFTCPTLFVNYSLQIRPQFFSFGCHPPGECHPGRSAPPPLVTPLYSVSVGFEDWVQSPCRFLYVIQLLMIRQLLTTLPATSVGFVTNSNSYKADETGHQ